MAISEGTAIRRAYLNPVYRRDFPDPFILKYCGEYWAYCTGFQADGGVFGILHSRDLVQWHEAGSAMAPLPGDHTCSWAPEVTYHNGRFLMYYSVGNEERMHIRVAVAGDPAGPFVDSGRHLTTEPFAIDPHVFQDDDGAWYLFYATDFLDHSHIGTGTVSDRMLDPFTPAGRPQPITRARFEWQVYDPQRAEKGGVRWYTVEGPFVLKHKGLYYQMFSGGNWRNVTYGVAYAYSDRVSTEEEWSQVCDGERVLPILRTVPEEVVGPGHNSVVRGPNNQQLYCVYHRWGADGRGRLLAIDPLEWAGERMVILGPSTTPQPAPPLPTVAGFSETGDSDALGPRWHYRSGRWTVRGQAAWQEATDATAEARLATGASAFTVEVSLRVMEVAEATDSRDLPAVGAGLYDGRDGLLGIRLLPATKEAAIAWRHQQGWSEEKMPLPGFEATAYHLLRLEVDGRQVHLSLDDVAVRWQGQLDAEAVAISLNCENVAAAFAGFELTAGWQDLFRRPDGQPAAASGWQQVGESGDWRIKGQQLWQLDEQAAGGLVKGPRLESYEFVVNARLAGTANGVYGFYPALRPDGSGPLLTVEPDGAGWSLWWREPSHTGAFPLPAHFDPGVYQHFRGRKTAGRLAIYYEAQLLGEAAIAAEAARVGLYAGQAVVAFDMVRVTAIRADSEQ